MKKSIQEILLIKQNPEDVYVIHSSYGKTDNLDHFHPRFYCIYIKNIDASYSNKFSIEKYASKSGIGINDISDWYDDLEISILDELNSLLKAKSECQFIYWAEDGNELILDLIKSRFDELNNDGNNKEFQII